MLVKITTFGCILTLMSGWICRIVTTETLLVQAQRYTFHYMPDPYRGPLRLSPGWPDSTPVSCSINCINSYSTCRSFMFNNVTRHCIPGARADDSKPEPLPTASEGSFYFIVKCDIYPGFSLRTYGSAAACVGMFESKFTYTQAITVCKRKDAFLMAVKTLGKLMILREISGSRDAWVGCDDLKTPGRYGWRDNGALLSNVTKAEVFDNGEPTGHCVHISNLTGRLGTSPCKLAQPIVCERPIM